MDYVLRIAILVVGFLISASTIFSAMETFVLPRGTHDFFNSIRLHRNPGHFQPVDETYKNLCGKRPYPGFLCSSGFVNPAAGMVWFDFGRLYVHVLGAGGDILD